MPHFKSLDFFDYKKFCNENNIHFIDPRKNVVEIINDLINTKLLITEAMHGAIVADALRTPWLPVKMHAHVNEFKWQDWSRSMEIKHFDFNRLKPLYDLSYLEKISKNKLPINICNLHRLTAGTFSLLQKATIEKKISKRLQALFKLEGYLSNDKILDIRLDQLLGKIELFKKQRNK